jgi:hypothetical protein
MYVDIGSAVVLGKNKKEIIVMNFWKFTGFILYKVTCAECD